MNKSILLIILFMSFRCKPITSVTNFTDKELTIIYHSLHPCSQMPDKKRHYGALLPSMTQKWLDGRPYKICIGINIGFEKLYALKKDICLEHNTRKIVIEAHKGKLLITQLNKADLQRRRFKK